jgi:hypothetical protein
VELRTKKSQQTAIPARAKVKVIQAGHIIEISHSTNKGKGLEHIKRISKEHYVRTDTGEVGSYQLGATKADTQESLKRTLHRIRMMINANFEGGQAELFITLTYAENMTDTERLQRDYKAFTRKLRKKYPTLELLAVTEPQQRGAWHWHILAKDKTGAQLYIPDSEIRELWGNGITQTKRLHDCDNVGAYLTAYLANIVIEPETEQFWELVKGSDKVEKIEIDGKTKAIVKGARLNYYPAGMKIYRATKGIDRPKQQEMSYAAAKEKARGSTPSFTQKICISSVETDGTERPLQTVQYEQYNTKRTEKTSNLHIT